MSGWKSLLLKNAKEVTKCRTSRFLRSIVPRSIDLEPFVPDRSGDGGLCALRSKEPPPHALERPSAYRNIFRPYDRFVPLTSPLPRCRCPSHPSPHVPPIVLVVHHHTATVASSIATPSRPIILPRFKMGQPILTRDKHLHFLGSSLFVWLCTSLSSGGGRGGTHDPVGDEPPQPLGRLKLRSPLPPLSVFVFIIGIRHSYYVLHFLRRSSSHARAWRRCVVVVGQDRS